MKKVEASKHNFVFPLKRQNINNLFNDGLVEDKSIQSSSIKQKDVFSDINKNPIIENKSLKWNRYNFIDKIDDNKYILFNCSTNNFMYMTEEMNNIILENMNNIHEIESFYPEVYSFLKEKQFIIEKNFDEVKDAISKIQNNLNTSDYFELIINPTLDCNLRCWYCYETHQKKSTIDNDKMKSIMYFIKNKIESQDLKEILVTFFGGEPLIKFDDVIRPLIKYTQEICAQNEKSFYVCFISNGVLLTKKIVDQLYNTGLNYTFQIPFDGYEEYHNKIKKYANGKGTFDKIIDNIMYALSKGFRFIIRCNYTSENLHSFDKLIALFNEYASDSIAYGQLKFSYHKIWQVQQTDDMQPVVNQFEAKTKVVDIVFDTCYADRNNSVVVNYNGDIYNCTARDFSPESREGYLNEYGKIVYNEKHDKRMAIRFSNENCLQCIIFPICNICSQVRLERKYQDVQCLRFISEEDKRNILLKKMQIMTKG